MDRFKLIALLALPLLITLAPGPWIIMEPQVLSSTKVGQTRDDRINECSGIAISRTTKNAMWMHNDSGDSPRLFLTGLNGDIKSQVTLKGIKALDWEDVCSFTLDDRNWVLVGDTGDNQKNRAKRRAKARLHLFEEPTSTDAKIKVKVKRTIEFEYEDGPHDCEGIAVDTKTQTILLITKSLLPSGCQLYSLPLKPENKKKAIARKIADLPIPVATAMDLSPDGLRLIVITPRVGFLITRTADEPWSTATGRAPTVVELPNAQQTEAVCFSSDAKHVYVMSEGLNQAIWRLKLK